MNNEYYCPVKRIKKSKLELKIEDRKDDTLDIKINMNIKNPIKILIDRLNKGGRI